MWFEAATLPRTAWIFLPLFVCVFGYETGLMQLLHVGLFVRGGGALGFGIKWMDGGSVTESSDEDGEVRTELGGWYFQAPTYLPAQ